MKLLIGPYLKKNPENAILHVGTNPLPCLPSRVVLRCHRVKKKITLRYVPAAKTIFSTPVIRVYKANVNENAKKYNELLKEANLECIFYYNIAEYNIDR